MIFSKRGTPMIRQSSKKSEEGSKGQGHNRLKSISSLTTDQF
jgi:hypothetical protein